MGAIPVHSELRYPRMNSSSAMASNNPAIDFGFWILDFGFSWLVLSMLVRSRGSVGGPWSLIRLCAAGYGASGGAEAVADGVAADGAVGAVDGGRVQEVRIVDLNYSLAGDDPESLALPSPAVELAGVEDSHLGVGCHDVAPVAERLPL